MEAAGVLKHRRGSLRTSFTRSANALEEEWKVAAPDTDKLASILEQLEAKGEALIDLDNAVVATMEEEGCTSDEFTREFDVSQAYRDRLVDCRTRTKRLMSRLEGGSEPSNSVVHVGTTSRKYRLPEIELKKFGGDLRDWLGFWGQFRKIDEDPNVAPEDKFQYLTQATLEKSKAREIVESFPPTAENYCRAVEHLKSRFGREETLVEVYVRDLLRLVLGNALNPKRRVILSTLYDKLVTQLRALETLGVTSDKYAAMLYPLVESCLPEDVLRAWERSRGLVTSINQNSPDPNQLSLLMKFLRSEVDGEERISLAKTGFGLDTKSTRKTEAFDVESIPTAAGLFGAPQEAVPQQAPLSCLFCGGNHPSAGCLQARKMSTEQRRSLAAQKGVCFLCLKKGHRVRTCSKKHRCTDCQRRHHVLLCPGLQPPVVTANLPRHSTTQPIVSTTVDHAFLANQTQHVRVQLQTLQVRLRGSTQNLVVRALIDSGSQKSYLSSHVATRLGYAPLGEEEVVHNLFGGGQTACQRHKKYKVYLSSLDGNFHCNFEVLDQNKICTAVPCINSGPWIKELGRKGIVLSDLNPAGSTSAPCFSPDIHVLIGADVAGKLWTGQLLPLTCGAVAMESKLGWTLMGKMETPGERTALSSIISLYVHKASVEDLWRLDTLGIRDPGEVKTTQQLTDEVFDHFKQTVERDNEGRYIVSLPWLEGHQPLGENRELAEKRLGSTVRRLQADGILEEYQVVLHNWLREGIIEEVPLQRIQYQGHYLPHRAVVKEASETTKIRPVFDASAHQRNRPSINDCLANGPNLIELIPTVLQRFRMGAFGVSADIKQAFLQIAIQEKDRDFLRFLWWENGSPEKPREYRHCRVVFGLSCSPFLLGATLQHHLEQVSEPLRPCADLLKNTLYVDNCLASLDDLDSVTRFVQEATSLLNAAHFELRGWKSNASPVVLAGEVLNAAAVESEGNQGCVSVLGLLWDLKDDTLRCDLKDLTNWFEPPVTKRKILTAAHKLFDPIGFTCPVSLQPKIQLQECWEIGATWDQVLPDNQSKQFEKWMKELHVLATIRIPRWLIGQLSSSDALSLHVFCDASQQAYAACVFLRVEGARGTSCRLVQAKTRVAPLKKITVPRLELLACTIGTRLAKGVRCVPHIQVVSTYFWTDSTNALHWIKGDGPWGVFVANRVNEIRAGSKPEEWFHVRGTLNPADLPSRGCDAQKLAHSRWWEGPTWLRMPKHNWPLSEPVADLDVVNSEKKKTVKSMPNVTTKPRWIWNRLSSYVRLVRGFAWVLRFIYNSRRKKPERRTCHLTGDEILEAERVILLAVQQETFTGPEDKCLRHLNVSLDQRSLMRVQTRLLRREDTDNFRYPIILPPLHPVVQLLIQERHRNACHAGTQLLMSALREHYWILKCRRTIRQIVLRCGRCRRFRVKRVESVPSPLPLDRVRDAAVFEVTGVDLAGPVYLRGAQKAWIILFTCAVYRALHLELVTSLSSDAFLRGFRRFVARRGFPKIMYSDNGTNFVGVANSWRNMKTSEQPVTWIFNPPTGAWWGGWWERLVRIVKDLLRRVLGRASLSYEELVTVLCDCEATINSRPLTYLSEDTDDLAPLTPALFLHERPGVGMPNTESLDHVALNRRHRYMRTLREGLRRRFRSEYLGQLALLPRSKGSPTIVRVGQVVMIGSDSKKRLDWPLGRVIDVFPGKDGQVRVVRLRTAKGEVTRPVQRVFPLEVGSDSEGEHYRRKIEVPRTTKGPEKDDGGTAIPTVTRRGRTVKVPDRFG